ncbi:MAG TPA: helix-turn-helix domain-containing protein [Nocardioides sp.]|nr:helix-turn-helix domain-containing protein [Nocardioides sp.]
MPIPLPLVGDEPQERRDAARNRDALLVAADALIAEQGVDAVTMEAIAARAGVGKGTVFRRFESREGLMAALLNRSESAFQAAIISGPPPVGPGAEAMERLLAFGHARIALNLLHRRLIIAAGRAGTRNYATVSFTAMHVRYLLTELGVRGDLPFFATALLAPLEVPVLEQQVEIEDMQVNRIVEAWDDLVRRVVAG